MLTPSVVDFIVIVLGLLSAWSMGHHYSGAVVGTAFGSKSIGMTLGIIISGTLVLLGALLSSVVSTYVSLAKIGETYSVIVLISFVLMTNLTTYLKVPTSTIQLYAFSVLGSALAIGTFIDLRVLSLLALSWVAAPVISYFLGRLVFRLLPGSRHLKTGIIVIMAYSALVLGLNDVSNAASSLVASGFDLVFAKAICGFSMFFGMLMWGSRLVKRVGVELIDLDYKKALAAQLTKSVIISSLNIFGLNASMNQTIISALASMGARKRVLRSVVMGWVYSPAIGFATAYLLSILLKAGGF